MELIDWIVMSLTMFVVIGYGIYKTRKSENISDFLLGGNEAKWWTVGLSVMATQASAITFLSTPGQAYNDGMEFLQFYFMLPVAIIIICITFIPIYYKLKVYTAYEYLEGRFDLKTRSYTSFLFLLQRGFAAGITIYAPAIVLSAIMGWNLSLTTLFIGCIAILYTVTGGTKAVHVTHKLQMIIILLGLIFIAIFITNKLPDEYTMSEMIQVASISGKLKIIDTDFSWSDRYNIYACLIAAPFLFLSYFGTDQSQVQRYISGTSVSSSRIGLLMNAFAKVPLQFFILFIGLLVFMFYQFNQAPIFFNEKLVDEIESSYCGYDAKEIQEEYTNLLTIKNALNERYINNQKRNDHQLDNNLIAEIAQKNLREKELRAEYQDLIYNYDNEANTNDKDYVFINFILRYVPKGLVGLLFAMIFFAAMSSTSSELNALATTTTVDIYKRSIKQDGNDKHYLMASKFFTLFWGVVAVCFAFVSNLFENLIQLVNIVGSLFYGTILGIFLVAFYIKRIGANAVFYAALLAELVVLYFYFNVDINYLWLNLIGALGVILIAFILQLILRPECKLKPTVK